MRAFGRSLVAIVTAWSLAWPNVTAAALFDLTGTWSTGHDKFKKATLTNDGNVCSGVFTRTSTSDPGVSACADPCL